MNNLLSYSLSALIVLSNFNAHAGDDPRAIARSNIKQTQHQAQTHARNLVSSDFGNALLELLSETAKVENSSPIFQSYISDINKLESKVQSLIEQTQEIQDNGLSGQAIFQIWEEYKNAVRKRFENSFQAQETFYNQSLFIGAAEKALSRFKNTCETGRSQKDIDFYNPTMTNLPPAKSDIFIEYGWGHNGGLGKITSQSSSPSGEDSGRQTTGAILNTSATVALSIAAQGGAGQLIATCSVAAPYLAGAAIAYALISSSIAAEEHYQVQSRISEANKMIFRDSASDSDVSRYYKETCKGLLPTISTIQKKLTDIQKSTEHRNSLVRSSLALQPELEKFEKFDSTARKYIQYINLAQAAFAGGCKPRLESTENPYCFKGITHYVLASNEKIELPLEEVELKAIINPMEQAIEMFGKEFPKERRAELIATKVLLALAPNWDMTSRALNSLSYEVIDASMASLFQKIQLLFTLLQTDKNALWNKKNPLLDEEKEAINTFESLKTTHRALVNEGVKVIFNKAPRDQFQNKVTAYIEKARSFTRMYSYHKEVKSFMSSVDVLSRTYKKL